MERYKEIMKQAENGLEKVIRESRVELQRGAYKDEFINELIEKKSDKLRERIHEDMNEELEKTINRMEELRQENDLILPKANSIDELLRRQEIELEISLMDDEAFKEYAKKTLSEEHHYFDEMRLFSELRKRGQGLEIDTIKSIRETRLKENPEYKELSRKKSMYEVLGGFNKEVSYETEAGEVVYNDLDKIKERVYAKNYK